MSVFEIGAEIRVYLERGKSPIDPGASKEFINAAVSDHRQAVQVLIVADEGFSAMVVFEVNQGGKITGHQHDQVNWIDVHHFKWPLYLY
jgi:hypothetical protein